MDLFGSPSFKTPAKRAGPDTPGSLGPPSSRARMLPQTPQSDSLSAPMVRSRSLSSLFLASFFPRLSLLLCSPCCTALPPAALDDRVRGSSERGAGLGVRGAGEEAEDAVDAERSAAGGHLLCR